MNSLDLSPVRGLKTRVPCIRALESELEGVERVKAAREKRKRSGLCSRVEEEMKWGCFQRPVPRLVGREGLPDLESEGDKGLETKPEHPEVGGGWVVKQLKRPSQEVSAIDVQKGTVQTSPKEAGLQSSSSRGAFLGAASDQSMNVQIRPLAQPFFQAFEHVLF